MTSKAADPSQSSRAEVAISREKSDLRQDELVAFAMLVAFRQWRMRVQKFDIHIPLDDPIDLWDLTRLIAKSICPDPREAEDYAWVQKKLVKLSNSDLEIQSDMTIAERSALLRILPGLPARAGMSTKDREMFMNAYLKHPDRLPWKPVFVSEEAVAAIGLQILQIQEKHRLALQKEIACDRIVAFDHHHISENRAGKNIFIRREDALRYLKTCRFRTTEDPGALSASPEPKSRASVVRSVAPATASFRDHQYESVDADTVDAHKGGTALVDHVVPIVRTDGASAFDRSSMTRPPFQREDSKACRSPKKSTEIFPELEMQNTVTVILRRRQVEARTSLSRSAIYDRLDPNSPRHDATFPKQLKLGGRGVGWIESEIEAWLSTRKSSRHFP